MYGARLIGRLRGPRILLLAPCLFALSACGGSAGTHPSVAADRGKDRPPVRLTDDQKALWMTEWTACWRVELRRLSSALHVRVDASAPLQTTATKLAKRAMQDLYETEEELRIGADGCRNGILWRRYHPS